VLVFERPARRPGEPALICVANLGTETVSVDELLPPVVPVLASGPLPAMGDAPPADIPPDTAVWFTAPATAGASSPTGWTIT
jgi:hypothetical protein